MSYDPRTANISSDQKSHDNEVSSWESLGRLILFMNVFPNKWIRRNEPKDQQWMICSLLISSLYVPSSQISQPNWVCKYISEIGEVQSTWLIPNRSNEVSPLLALSIFCRFCGILHVFTFHIDENVVQFLFVFTLPNLTSVFLNTNVKILSQ